MVTAQEERRKLSANTRNNAYKGSNARDARADASLRGRASITHVRISTGDIQKEQGKFNDGKGWMTMI